MSKQTIIIQPDGVSAKKCNPYWKIDRPELWAEYDAGNPPYPTIGEFEPGIEMLGKLIDSCICNTNSEIIYCQFGDSLLTNKCERQAWQIETPKQAEPTIKEITVEEMIIVDRQKYPVDNGSGGDHVSEYFIKVVAKYNGNPLVDVKYYENSNDRLSILKIDDKTVASVIETRTEFNHVEFVFSELPNANTSAQAERERIVGIIQSFYKKYDMWQERYQEPLTYINKGI